MKKINKITEQIHYFNNSLLQKDYLFNFKNIMQNLDENILLPDDRIKIIKEIIDLLVEKRTHELFYKTMEDSIEK